jgi:preprotein translocase subunit SecD
MINIPRWKIILILVICAWGVLYSLPNVLNLDQRAWMKSHLPAWAPSKTVNLGLDLQGGSHILLQVDLSSVLKEHTEEMISALRPDLREQKIGYKRMVTTANGIRITLRDAKDEAAVTKMVRALDPGLTVTTEGADTIDASFSDQSIKTIKDQAIGQSIEIVRRRVDETGTNEPVIQRQGDDRIVVQLPGLDDPQRVKDLLGKTAKLSFHLVDMDVASNLKEGGGSFTLPIQNEPGRTLALERRAMITGDMLAHAAYAQDQNGQSAVSFRMNSTGAKRFCDVSRENVGRLFAIVLDREIISAPVIREAICGGSGQISGSFSVKDANDLALLLRAGALPAPLKIIEERTVGPSLGADSIAAGEFASGVGIILTLSFMCIVYSLFGVFASIAMVLNVMLMIAVMSALQATLTLPGIIGIVLTIGMSVDANVLIFERIREELRSGKSLINTLESGFKMALGTIIDSNMTTLIAAVILYSFGTGPIKGFAVTMGIGIITSFFTAIMVTSLMVSLWVRKQRPTELPL